MTDQTRIGADGSIEYEPLTWDGEPLYSPETVAERPELFSSEAFRQLDGQLAMPSCPECDDFPDPDFGCAACQGLDCDHDPQQLG